MSSFLNDLVTRQSAVASSCKVLQDAVEVLLKLDPRLCKEVISKLYDEVQRRVPNATVPTPIPLPVPHPNLNMPPPGSNKTNKTTPPTNTQVPPSTNTQVPPYRPYQYIPIVTPQHLQTPYTPTRPTDEPDEPVNLMKNNDLQKFKGNMSQGTGLEGNNNLNNNYVPRVKITPTKLTTNTEFRLWLEVFLTYVNRYPFRGAFNLENPEIIENPAIKNEAKAAILEWLDEFHRKLVFGEPCPTKCLLRVKQYHEPDAEGSEIWEREIHRMNYHPDKDKLETWLTKFESLGRKLMASGEWDESKMTRCLLGIMQVPFPNIKNIVSGVGGPKTYESMKGNLFKEESLYHSRRDLFLLEKGAARMAQESYGFSVSDNTQKEQVTCYRCQGNGHIARHCTNPPQPRPRPQTARTSRWDETPQPPRDRDRQHKYKKAYAKKSHKSSHSHSHRRKRANLARSRSVSSSSSSSRDSSRSRSRSTVKRHANLTRDKSNTKDNSRGGSGHLRICD